MLIQRQNRQDVETLEQDKRIKCRDCRKKLSMEELGFSLCAAPFLFLDPILEAKK